MALHKSDSSTPSRFQRWNFSLKGTIERKREGERGREREREGERGREREREGERGREREREGERGGSNDDFI